jgi:hypothetical protein
MSQAEREEIATSTRFNATSIGRTNKSRLKKKPVRLFRFAALQLFDRLLEEAQLEFAAL